MKYQQYFELLEKDKIGSHIIIPFKSSFDFCVNTFDLNKNELDLFIDKDFKNIYIHDKKIILIVSILNYNDLKIKVYKINEIKELNYEYFDGDEIMLGISFVLESKKYSHVFVNDYFEFGNNFLKNIVKELNK